MQRKLSETTTHHWPPATLLEFLNEATRQVVLDCPVAYTAEWTGTTSTGQRDYTLPSDFVPPLWSVVFRHGQSDEAELGYLPQEQAARYNASGNSTPVGFTYVHKGGSVVVRLLPAPSVSTIGDLMIHCSRFPSTLASSDSLPLNLIFQDAVVSLARAYAWEEWEQWDYAARARMEYEGRMARGRKLLGEPLNAYEIPTDMPGSPLAPSERGDW